MHTCVHAHDVIIIGGHARMHAWNEDLCVICRWFEEYLLMKWIECTLAEGLIWRACNRVHKMTRNWDGINAIEMTVIGLLWCYYDMIWCIADDTGWKEHEYSHKESRIDWNESIRNTERSIRRNWHGIMATRCQGLTTNRNALKMNRLYLACPCVCLCLCLSLIVSVVYHL